MDKDLTDFHADMHEIKTIFTILNHTYNWCEQEDIYPYHLAYLLEILDAKIKGLTREYDRYLLQHNL